MPNGLVCFVSRFVYGSMHDFNLFKTNLNNYYKPFLQKESAPDQYWSIMADKGYQGAAEFIPSVLPTKGTSLTSAEQARNTSIGAARIICENYYGRLKVLWGAARMKVHTNLSYYDNMIDICVGLTNFHVENKPLRTVEAVRYRRISLDPEDN